MATIFFTSGFHELAPYKPLTWSLNVFVCDFQSTYIREFGVLLVSFLCRRRAVCKIF
jgi:hypothetical protein